MKWASLDLFLVGPRTQSSLYLPYTSYYLTVVVVVIPQNSYCKGRLSTVDFLLLMSLDELIFILKMLFTFVTKHATLM